MDIDRQLEQLGPLLGGVVGAIRPDQLDEATPCAGFTVRDVLEHMIGGATRFAAAFRREAAAAAAAQAGGVDVLAGFGPALGTLADSMTAPGALEGTVEAPFGVVPTETFARFVVLDGLVHGWDLATATGQPYEPPAELVATVQAFAAEAVPPLRDGGSTFADQTVAPAGASPIERLVAFTGRTVPVGAA